MIRTCSYKCTLVRTGFLVPCGGGRSRPSGNSALAWKCCDWGQSHYLIEEGALWTLLPTKKPKLENLKTDCWKALLDTTEPYPRIIPASLIFIVLAIFIVINSTDTAHQYTPRQMLRPRNLMWLGRRWRDRKINRTYGGKRTNTICHLHYKIIDHSCGKGWFHNIPTILRNTATKNLSIKCIFSVVCFETLKRSPRPNIYANDHPNP